MNNLLSSISIIGLLVMLGVSFYLGGKFQSPEIITETETIIDTVTVVETKLDTVYVETIPKIERDTVYVEAYDISDIYVDEYRNITSYYSDSILTAEHYLQINKGTGTITNNSFKYLLKQRLVRKRETEFTTTVTKAERTTRTIREGMYFQAGVLTNFDYFTPIIGVTTRDKITVLYGYDPFTKTHTTGISTKF